MERIQKILPALRKSAYPNEELLLGLNKKFDGLINDTGRDYITNGELRQQICDEINAEGSRYANLPSKIRGQIITRKFNAIAKNDRDRDGKTTRTEFINGQCALELSMILDGEGDNYDGALSKEEIVKFLKNWCDADIEKDAEAIRTTFMPKDRDPEKDVPTQAVIDGFFALLCPDAKARVQKLVKKVYKSFKPSERQKEYLNSKFDEYTKEKEYITFDEFNGFLREYIRGLHYTTGTRTAIRHITDSWVRMFHMWDRDADGRVSRSEFVCSGSYVKILASLVEYDADNDLIMDRPELIKWVSEKLNLTENVEDYVDAITHEFMAEGDSELKGMDLVAGLFNRAFPNDSSRLKHVRDAVARDAGYSLNEEELENKEKEFKAAAGDLDYITMEKYEELSKVEVEKELVDAGLPTCAIPSVAKGTVATRMDMMRNLDRSNDGKVTQTEFFLGAVLEKITASMIKRAGGDGTLDKDEMIVWLSEDLGLTDDADLTASAVIMGLREEGEEGKLDAFKFAYRLFELAFPPDFVLVNKVINEIRLKFAPTDKEEKAIIEEFEKLAGPGKTSMTKDVAKQAATDYINSVYGKRAEAILPKRLAAIDLADVNNDGMVSNEEFFRTKLYEKIFLSLHAFDSDGSLAMSRAELLKWLGEKLHLTDASFVDALLGTFLSGANPDKLDIDSLMHQLFDRVCTKDRVKPVVDAMKAKFDSKEAMTDSLRELFKSQKCSVQQFADWLEQTCGMKEESKENAAGAWERINMDGNPVWPKVIIDVLLRGSE